MYNSSEQYSSLLQWSPSQREQLRQCKEKLKLTEEGVECLESAACNVKDLKIEINSLRNKLSEFDSDLFIVTTIGMLKAGKSTLVNLLARSNLASPTGFGFDTTLRPALITQATNDKGEIQIWFKNESNTDSIENALDEVFAFVRGVIPGTAKAYVVEHTLSAGNLKNALCKLPAEADGNMLPKEPLLVVVKVPSEDNALLSDKIAILDTPGLDSGVSEWSQDKDNCYRWLLRRSDLILFLQSSVAPLNETAATILKEIQKSERSAPIWLVHNVMEAKHWLKPEVMNQEIQEQREMANVIFKKVVDEGFSCFQANLGKAHSAVLASKQVSEIQIQALLQESCFESLEFSVKESLNSSAGKIRKNNCCMQALESVSCMIASFDSLLGVLLEKHLRLENEKQCFERMFNNFLEHNAKEGISASFRQFVREKIVIDPAQWNSAESWERRLEDKVNAIVEDKKKYSAHELNEIIKNIAEELGNEIYEKAYSIRLVNIRLNSSGDGNSVGDITKKLLDIFEKYIKTIADEDKSGKLNKFLQRYQKALPSFNESIELALPSGLEDIRSIKVEKKWDILWEIKKDSSEARKQIKNAIRDSLVTFYKACDEKLYVATLRWINETALSYLVNDFGKSLEEYVSANCKELDEKLISLDGIISFTANLKESNCQEMREHLERISQENE